MRLYVIMDNLPLQKLRTREKSHRKTRTSAGQKTKTSPGKSSNYEERRHIMTNKAQKVLDALKKREGKS
jgi:hypothetical protein